MYYAYISLLITMGLNNEKLTSDCLMHTKGIK